MTDLEDRLKEALAQAAHGLFATAPAKPKTWDQLTEDMRTKYREQFAAPLVPAVLTLVEDTMKQVAEMLGIGPVEAEELVRQALEAK